jgi:peptidoglycan hydrolase-like protein with peptidoglycan-binding domain
VFAIVGCGLAGAAKPVQAQTAAIASFDDSEAQLRLRQAANVVGTATREVEELRKGLEAERKRVVMTNEERELNQETIKKLEKNLKNAEARLKEAEAALNAVQEERRRGLAAESERQKVEESQRQRAEEERRRQEAALNPPQSKPAQPPPPPPEEPQLTLLERQKLQVALAAQSFDPGPPDGQFGQRTRLMIAAWQRVKNQPATGYITKAQYLSLLQASAAAINRFEQDQRQQNQPPAPAPSQPPPVAGPGGGDPYHVTNSCRYPLRILVRYRDSTKDWTTAGWWTFAPGEPAYLAMDDQRILSRNSIWYFYAETTDGSNKVWEGTEPVGYKGKTYKMKRKVDEVGVNKLNLTCD